MVLSLSAAPLFGGVVLGGEIKQTEIDSSKQLTAANSQSGITCFKGCV